MHFHIYASDASVSRSNRNVLFRSLILWMRKHSSKILRVICLGTVLDPDWFKLVNAHWILESFKDLKNIISSSNLKALYILFKAMFSLIDYMTSFYHIDGFRIYGTGFQARGSRQNRWAFYKYVELYHGLLYNLHTPSFVWVVKGGKIMPTYIMCLWGSERNRKCLAFLLAIYSA